MKFIPGQKVKIVKQGIRYRGHNYAGMVGTIIQASQHGYHVVLAYTGKEATFFEDELEAA